MSIIGFFRFAMGGRGEGASLPVFLEMTGSWGASPETARRRCVRKLCAAFAWVSVARGTYLSTASSQSFLLSATAYGTRRGKGVVLWYPGGCWPQRVFSMGRAEAAVLLLRLLRLFVAVAEAMWDLKRCKNSGPTSNPPTVEWHVLAGGSAAVSSIKALDACLDLPRVK